MKDPSRDHDPGAWRLRGGRVSVPFHTYFITKCVEARRPILADPSAAEIVIESLAHIRRQGQIKLLAFVVMPDHYHAVFSLLPGHDLSDLMRRVGSYTGNRIRRTLHLGHVVWQVDGFYDRACRNEGEVLDAVEYVHDNIATFTIEQAKQLLTSRWRSRSTGDTSATSWGTAQNAPQPRTTPPPRRSCLTRSSLGWEASM
jgi:REP element-mobilizing transposase RayT